MAQTMGDWGNPETTTTNSQFMADEIHACSSLVDFNVKLRQQIENAGNALIPEFFSTELTIGPQVTFDIPTALLTTSSAIQLTVDEPQPTNTPPTKRRKLGTSAIDIPTQPMTLIEVLNRQPEKRPLPIQREVAKKVMNMVMEIDGFGWQNHNTSRSKDGWRLEYICNDSFQNQHRAGNKSRKADAAETAEQKKENRQALQTFDCMGRIYLIFSSTQGRLVIKYGHNPVHRTVKSRKQLQKQGFGDETPSVINEGPVVTSQVEEGGRTGSPESQGQQRQSSLNRHMSDRGHEGNGHGHPSAIQNPLYQSKPVIDSRYGTFPTQTPSASKSPYQSPIPNPLISPRITIMDHAQRSASIDFSMRRARALSRLAAAEIDFKTLSEYQMEVFQNQPPDAQLTSLRLFQEYGPRNLMVEVSTVPYTSNGSSTYQPQRVQQKPSSTQHVPVQSTAHPSNEASPPPDNSHDEFSPPPNMDATSNSSRRASDTSQTELGSPDDDNEAPSITSEKQAEGIVPVVELTVNGTPKQPGVFEHDPKKKVVAKLAEAGAKKGNLPRTKSTNHIGRGRSQTRCNSCRLKHTKCDGGQPTCDVCLKQGKQCSYVSMPRLGSNTSHPNSDSTAQTISEDLPSQFFEQSSENPNEDDAWLQGLIDASMHEG